MARKDDALEQSGTDHSRRRIEAAIGRTWPARLRREAKPDRAGLRRSISKMRSAEKCLYRYFKGGNFRPGLAISGD